MGYVDPGAPADVVLVREQIPTLGVVDVKIAAIDHDWSGQKVVWRKVKPLTVRR